MDNKTNGTALKYKSRQVKVGNEIAVRGNTIDFNFFSGFLPNPDNVLYHLGLDQDMAYLRIWDDPHLEAVMSSRRSGVKSLLWEIDRGKAKSRQAKVITKLFNDPDFQIYRIMGDIVESVFWGWQPIEIVWGRVNDDGLILPVKVGAKPQRWFHFDSDNNLRFKSTADPADGMIVPPNKFLLPRHDATYDNPYGVALLSKVYWPLTFKKAGEKFWIKFSEKYGMPFAIGKLPREAGDAEYTRLSQDLVKMIQDAVAAIPDDASVEIMEASGKKASADIYKELITWANNETSKAILGQTLTTQQDGTGSYALGQVHYAVRGDLIDEDKRLVENTFNELIKYIYNINFGAGDMPRFTLYKDEDVDQALATRDKTLTDTGQVQLTQEYVDRAYGFEKGDVIVKEPTPETPPANPFGFQEQSADEFKNRGKIDLANLPKDQKAIDNMLNSVTNNQFNDMSVQLVQPLIDIVMSSRDYNEANERMLRMFPNLNSDQLDDYLTKLMFMGNTMGRLTGSNR